MKNELLSFGLSLVATVCIMPLLIPFLHKIKFGQSIRGEGPQSHQVKKGTPTMGGIVFVIVPIIVQLLLFPQSLTMPKIQILVLAYLGYAAIGFIDDFIIVIQKNNAGLSAKMKFLMQSILAVVFFLMYRRIETTSILIPILNQEIELGFLYFFLIFIMFTAESNAVNLTDGLDGLCAGCSIIAMAPFVLFALRQDQPLIACFLLSVIGALIGYLFFNLHPAKIFMGDSGSLALGGLFAATAMVLKQELLLLIIGGVFLMETISVVLQVLSFKTTGKRIFKMAPIHHHFELCGMKETQVVMMFWGISLVLALIGLWIGVM